MSVRLLAVATLITAALPPSARAADPASVKFPGTAHSSRVELRKVADLVTYHPDSVNGCGLLLDLAAVDKSERLSLFDKRSLISPIYDSGNDDRWRLLLQDKKYEPFFKLVRVEAKLGEQPATPGETLACKVTSPSGQSVAGGYLIATTLSTPERVKAGQAEGFVEAEADKATGTLANGMQLETAFQQPIVRDGRVMIRLKKEYAGVLETTTVSELIVSLYHDCFIQSDQWDEEGILQYVKTVDASRISAAVPEVYRADPYSFAAQLMELSVYGVGYEEVANTKAVTTVK